MSTQGPLLCQPGRQSFFGKGLQVRILLEKRPVINFYGKWRQIQMRPNVQFLGEDVQDSSLDDGQCHKAPRLCVLGPSQPQTGQKLRLEPKVGPGEVRPEGTGGQRAKFEIGRLIQNTPALEPLLLLLLLTAPGQKGQLLREGVRRGQCLFGSGEHQEGAREERIGD